MLALFVAFGRMYDRSPAQVLGGLVMQARHLALLLVGFAVVVDLARGDWASLAATLVASASASCCAGGGLGDLIGLLARAPAAAALPGARRRPAQGPAARVRQQAPATSTGTEPTRAEARDANRLLHSGSSGIRSLRS